MGDIIYDISLHGFPLLTKSRQVSQHKAWHENMKRNIQSEVNVLGSWQQNRRHSSDHNSDALLRVIILSFPLFFMNHKQDEERDIKKAEFHMQTIRNRRCSQAQRNNNMQLNEDLMNGSKKKLEKALREGKEKRAICNLDDVCFTFISHAFSLGTFCFLSD